MAIRSIRSGDRFGRLVVVSPIGKLKGHSYFTCLCDCGTTKRVRKDHLVHGKISSCGCYLRESTASRMRTHGMRNTPEYDAWAHMLRRCYTPTTVGFHYYGGRGISVCERWRASFENFMVDMGKRPSAKYSLDRIDVNGNYEPDNCRWATVQQQATNTRRNHLVTYQGRTQTISEWGQEMDLNKETLRTRLERGWDIEEAFTARPFSVRHNSL